MKDRLNVTFFFFWCFKKRVNLRNCTNNYKEYSLLWLKADVYSAMKGVFFFAFEVFSDAIRAVGSQNESFRLDDFIYVGDNKFWYFIKCIEVAFFFFFFLENLCGWCNLANIDVVYIFYLFIFFVVANVHHYSRLCIFFGLLLIQDVGLYTVGLFFWFCFC